MLSVACPACKVKLRIKPELSGKRGKCPKCKEPFTVPPPSPAAPDPQHRPPPETPQRAVSETKEAAEEIFAVSDLPGPSIEEIMREEFSRRLAEVAPGRKRSPKEVMGEILRSFAGDFQRPRASVAYQLTVLPVALCMLLLPLLYVALVATVGWLTYAFALTGPSWGSVFRISRFAVLLYLAPLLAGLVLFLFLIKPLFALPGRSARKIVIERGEQPLLWAFVERIARAVGAPVPKQIVLDCDVNASAGFRRGFLSFFGHDLVLTIGLPLAYGMSVEQLGGILAHELGHFSQGIAMRLNYVVFRVNSWFARIVGQRDSWDEALEEWSEDSTFVVVMLTFLFARMCVGLTRMVLFVFLIISEVLSCGLLRQREYHADSFEISLIGTKTFESSTKRLIALSLANLQAWGLAQQSFQKDELPGNFPELTQALARMNAKELEKDAAKAIRKEKGSLLASHPTPQQRIDYARTLNRDGVFHNEQPATDLFREIGKLSQQVTFEMYYVNLRKKIRMDKFVPTDKMLNKYVLSRCPW